MFLLFLGGILSYQHVIVIPAYGTYEFGEKLDTKLASELMFDITLVSKGSLNYKLYKPTQPRSGLKQFLPLINNKYREKYNVDGDYVIVVENPNAEPMMASIGSYIDLDQKDEDLSLLTSMLNKSKINLDNLVNANIRLKELKEYSLRNAKKDRNWMLLLCVMPVIYVLVGFVSLKMQKAFFAPKNRK